MKIKIRLTKRELALFEAARIASGTDFTIEECIEAFLLQHFTRHGTALLHTERRKVELQEKYGKADAN